ncbi:phosphoserine phosphatase [Wickerhamomyces ciferrii]|uniref:phosphoserine phosphatase n=1 Tax=Wickerhamomyces ciferrii (strain ATCC 14091 / BCRC 22168 / CBS 111 / JCM 3599 / NBRC 0793 / NRRL Y-1031 F-60-10) TaxID=1206466 RepID=K0KMS4_WICCF|nr:phosphoserine phosphatase [Wickerhamomyces ciferrii]CCH42664.1 phosphoserine phosphatase [Wickerhamomyces ciferrii]
MSQYVITAIAHADKIEPAAFMELTRFIESLPIKINNIKTLSEDRVFDISCSLVFSDNESTQEHEYDIFAKIKEAILEWENGDKIDLIFQKQDEYRQDKRLVIFDMDSTLIYQEVIELIAAYAGVEDEVEKITTAAMNGEIDFKESLARRVKLLKGIDGTIWEDLKKKLQFTKGDFELTKALKAKGCKLAVLSGGFIELANFVKETLGLDYAYANNLNTEINSEGKKVFNGETIGDIVDGNKKAELVQFIADKESIELRAAMAVGDGSNDLPMMGVSGFGVAWNAKPRVQRLAPSKLNTDKISDILYILGHTDEEIKELLK